MRRSLTRTAILAFSAAILTGPAYAGSISFLNGQPAWQTTCVEPVAPLSVMSADSNAEAEAVNARVGQYNQYAAQMQTYMDCVSDESQNDSAATSRAIASSAQNYIDTAQQKVNALGARIKQRQDSED